MGAKFDKKGGYAGYNKNNKEREALDFYATPPEEATNILTRMNLFFEDSDIILDNSCGAGHLLTGIRDYFIKYEDVYPTIIGTDIKDRFKEDFDCSGLITKVGPQFDFLSDNYSCGTSKVDYTIINPPYSVATPFIQKSIDMSNKGVLALLRLQFIETQKRYEEIFSICPPTTVFVYVDRISCPKNGEFEKYGTSPQGYAWFWWDLYYATKGTQLNWIRRADKSLIFKQN